MRGPLRGLAALSLRSRGKAHPRDKGGGVPSWNVRSPSPGSPGKLGCRRRAGRSGWRGGGQKREKAEAWEPMGLQFQTSSPGLNLPQRGPHLFRPERKPRSWSREKPAREEPAKEAEQGFSWPKREEGGNKQAVAKQTLKGGQVGPGQMMRWNALKTGGGGRGGAGPGLRWPPRS